MDSRTRVLTALAHREPDRVPHFELGIDPALVSRLMDIDLSPPPDGAYEVSCADHNLYTVEQAKRIAAFLELDTICYTLRAPVYAQQHWGADGRPFYGRGLIQSEADLERIDLPDPHDDALYAEAARFASQKGEYAACFVTRAGVFPAILSMGIEGFSVALYDNPRLVERVLDLYFDWTAAVAEHICRLGFDIFVTTDDLAFKTAPLFSPRVFRERILPRYRRIAAKITLPWIVHTDGNVLPLIEDFIDLGVAGLHPLENGALDIRLVKRRYGDCLCLLGNVDLNILALGTPADVEKEVRRLIRDLAPGGGYIISSGNSLASYLRPENVLAFTRAVHEYGQYPITA